MKVALRRRWPGELPSAEGPHEKGQLLAPRPPALSCLRSPCSVPEAPSCRSPGQSRGLGSESMACSHCSPVSCPDSTSRVGERRGGMASQPGLSPWSGPEAGAACSRVRMLPQLGLSSASFQQSFQGRPGRPEVLVQVEESDRNKTLVSANLKH